MNSRSFLGNAFYSMFARVLYLLTRLAIPPMVLAHIGLQEYGLWSIAFVLVSYLGLSVSGFATVYVREIARAYHQQDIGDARQIISTGVFCTLLIGGLGCLLLWFCLPTLLTALDVAPAQQPMARQLLLGTTLIFLADMTLGVAGYILHGLQRLDLQQQIWTVSFLLEWLLLALFLHLGWGVYALLAAFALRYLYSIIASSWQVHRLWPALRPSWRDISLQQIRRLGQFSLLTQGSDLLAVLLHSADRLLLGARFGTSATALHDLGSKLPSTAISIPSAISQAVLAHASHPSLLSQPEARAALYQRALRLNLLVLLLPMPYLWLLPNSICIAWLGPTGQLAILQQILLWTTPVWHLHILTGPASSLMRAQGAVRYEFLYHALRATALLLAWLASTTLGGFVAIAAIGQGLAALLYLLCTAGPLQLPYRFLLQQILLPLLLAYLLAASLQPWLDLSDQASRADAWRNLLMAAAISLPPAILLFVLQLRPNEREQGVRFWQRRRWGGKHHVA